MENFILLRGTSFDGKEAKRVLEETNLDFTEVYSESNEHSPVLYTVDSVYTYKGLSEIKEYANSVKWHVQNDK